MTSRTKARVASREDNLNALRPFYTRRRVRGRKGTQTA